MSNNFTAFVATQKSMAERNGVRWDFPIMEDGRVPKELAWDLAELTGATPPPRYILRDFSCEKRALRTQAEPSSVDQRQAKLGPQALPIEWRELLKAVVIERAFISRNQPTSISNGVFRPLRFLATCARDKDPWDINRQDVETSVEMARAIQKSGKLADDVIGVARTVFDANSLSRYCPIATGERRKPARNRITKKVRNNLDERKGKERLPSEDAFWETVRIVWTEKPRSFLDFLRFAQLRMLILCGLRVGEATKVPLDWERWHEYTDINGVRAGDVGGISKSLMLRHFAEKQRTVGVDSVALHETVQHIPQDFESPLIETLRKVEDVTIALRERISKQFNTGRLFPEYETYQHVPITEMYTRLTGDPFVYEDDQIDQLIEEYWTHFDPTIFDRIEKRQLYLKRSGAKLRPQVRVYLGNKLGKGIQMRPPFRDEDGTPLNLLDRKNANYKKDEFLIGEFEDFIREAMPTKLSDTVPFNLADGSTLTPAEMLFLAPKRPLIEEREGRICDVTKYAFVGLTAPNDLIVSLSSASRHHPSIFEKYGRDEHARSHSITTHQFRHLQNTELFRLGVADTIITKRFNRRSVAQSYAYDHRSLAEDLASIDIPEAAEPLVTGKARDVLRLILAGKARGPMIDEFKLIQKEEGDEAAFVFLATEADGFHTTPYGHCVNSFTVEPCPKSLECFDGCRHLMATGLPRHIENLAALEKRYQTLIEKIDDHPAPDGAKKNMKMHSEQRLSAVRQTLATAAGESVFPSGDDLSVPARNPNRGPLN